MNESTASIARSTRAMMLSQVVTWTSSFVLMLFMPRYLGPEEYGRLYFAISVNAIAGLLMDLGLDMYSVKEVARDRSKVNTLLLNGGMLRVIVWAASLILTMAFVMLSGYPMRTISIVLVLGASNLFFGSYSLVHRFFIGLERLQYRSISIIVEKVFLAAVGIGLLLLGYGAFEIAVAMLLAMALNCFVSLNFLRRIIPIKLAALKPSSWPDLLRHGMPFMVSSVFAFIYYRVDVMMLSSMTNETVVGWYGAPYKLFDTLMFFPGILTSAVFPVLARTFQTSHESMHSTSRKVLDLTLIVAVPVMVGMAALAQPIIKLLFGLQQYSNSVILLQLLSVSLLLVYVDFVLNTVLISSDKQKKLQWVAIIATVINVTVNYAAIRYFHEHFGNGAIGAAITTGVTEACVMTMYIYLLPKGCFTFENVALAMKTLVSGATMWGMIWFVESYSPGWVVSGTLGCLVYALLLFALKVVSKREVYFLLNLLPFRKQVAATISRNEGS